MTIGERIAQQRKALQLSQEALGEALGVSRQAISKWESDAALPEVEKIVAMSRLFGISVGALLGVEEPECAGEAVRTEKADNGINAEEIAEQIALRYIAAQQKKERDRAERRRNQRRLAAAGAAAAVLILTVAYQNLHKKIDDMEDDYMNLQWEVRDISNSLNVQIDSMTRRIEVILKAQNQLVADAQVERCGIDVAGGTLTYALSATPKQYEEGMEAVFVSDSGGVITEQPAQTSGPDFSATLTCPLSDTNSFSVRFITAAGTQTQLLDTVEEAERSTKYTFSSAGGSYGHEITVKDGTVTFGAGYASVVFQIGDPACMDQVWIETMEIGYYVNDTPASIFQADPRTAKAQIVEEGTVVLEPEDTEAGKESYFAFLPETVVEASAGDVICLQAVGTDNIGRQFGHVLWNGQVTSHGIRENVPISGELE